MLSCCSFSQLGSHCRECGSFIDAGKCWRVDVQYSCGIVQAHYVSSRSGADELVGWLRSGYWMGNRAIKLTDIDMVALWHVSDPGRDVELVDFWDSFERLN